MCLLYYTVAVICYLCFFFQAEDGIRDLVRSRGLGDVYKRQRHPRPTPDRTRWHMTDPTNPLTHFDDKGAAHMVDVSGKPVTCLLYTSDAADERSSVDLGGRRIIKKKKKQRRDVSSKNLKR